MNKSIEIKLDKIRHLRYGYVAISYIEQNLKRPIAKVDFNNLTMLEFATIIAAGLLHENNEIAPQTVLEIFDDCSADIEYIAEKMNEAIEEAFDTGKKRKDQAK